MERLFQINQQLDIPIYQQLVDRVRAAVKKGELTPGQKLPTVQELADRLGVAKGTVKRAYDELEHSGVLEKNQGRGTFICYQPIHSGSRKEQAMEAIDSLLEKLEDMGFSPMEINIFLTLKQRERFEDPSTVKVAILESNPEALSQISEQLRNIKGVELYSYLLETIQEYPYKLDEEIDVVVTTASHASYLETILPDKKKIVRVALRIADAALTALLQLKSGAYVGILVASEQFAQMLHDTCRTYVPGASIEPPAFFDRLPDGYFEGMDAVLVPKCYEKYCPDALLSALQRFEKCGKLIQCAYEIDEGSRLGLEEKLEQLQNRN